MEKYQELNLGLDEYLKSNENLVYINNLEVIFYLAKKADESLVDPNKKFGRTINIHFKESIDGLTTITLVREFLATINNDLVNLFDNSFKNGTFGFCNTQDEPTDIIFDCQGIDEANHEFFNVDFKGNITDGETLVHEFFHYDNQSFYVARDFLTEAISIYMENKYLDFLEAKGYNKTDILNCRLGRYVDFYYAIKPLSIETFFLHIKKTIGILDDKNYDFVKNYQKSLNLKAIMPKEVYLKNIDVFLKRFRDKSAKKPDYICRYFIGTLLSSYLLERENCDTIYKVAKMSKVLQTKVNTFEALKVVDIDLEQINPNNLINSVKRYYFTKLSLENTNTNKQSKR